MPVLPVLLLLFQQVADPGFHPPIPSPSYAEGAGPVVAIDEAHNNFHTAGGRYLAFADLLRRDGYRIARNTTPFTPQSLKTCRVLVISNALNERNRTDWTLPTPPAFTDAEVAAVKNWVHAGGSLLLISDHMPFPGAASTLAAAFGVRFSNGFALDPGAKGGQLFFRRADQSLREHAVTQGIETVVTFTGSAFQADGAEPVLVLPGQVVSFEPKQAWQFNDETPRVPVGDWFQGATLKPGRGRLAVFGEAAMFSAQLAGPAKQPMGMNNPDAKDNPRLLLNLMRWLSPPATRR